LDSVKVFLGRLEIEQYSLLLWVPIRRPHSLMSILEVHRHRFGDISPLVTSSGNFGYLIEIGDRLPHLVVGIEQINPIRRPELVISVEDTVRVAIARSFARYAGDVVDRCAAQFPLTPGRLGEA